MAAATKPATFPAMGNTSAVLLTIGPMPKLTNKEPHRGKNKRDQTHLRRTGPAITLTSCEWYKSVVTSRQNGQDGMHGCLVMGQYNSTSGRNQVACCAVLMGHAVPAILRRNCSHGMARQQLVLAYRSYTPCLPKAANLIH